ncbi:MAG: DNA repair protein RecO [Bacteroidales bacterium]|nr:DNA repair protein RecO [Bacteroidales bacterium]
MNVTTRGIVFNKVKYGESSLIVKVLTEELGLQSYLVKGVNSKNARLKPSLFQPLSLLEMVVYHKGVHGLQHIKEARIAQPWQHIPFSPEKQSILMFLDEVLYKTIRHETPDKELFQWIFQALVWFDLEEKNFLNFHLLFLIQLARFLGFSPKKETGGEETLPFFDMQEGHFAQTRPGHPYYLESQQTETFFTLTQIGLEGLKNFHINNTQRRSMVDALVTYYQLHLPELGKIKSLEVLRVMSEAGKSK